MTGRLFHNVSVAASDRMKEESTVRAINEWLPNRRHCSDCRHAIVSGKWPSPVVHCELGIGKRYEIQLAALLRSHGPGFKAATNCTEFDSMNDKGVR